VGVKRYKSRFSLESRKMRARGGLLHFFFISEALFELSNFFLLLNEHQTVGSMSEAISFCFLWFKMYLKWTTKNMPQQIFLIILLCKFHKTSAIKRLTAMLKIVVSPCLQILFSCDLMLLYNNSKNFIIVT
jgi:hypothetical protein